MHNGQVRVKRRESKAIPIFVGLAVLLALIMAGIAPALGDEQCVPSDAWTEYKEHPAEYKDVHHDAEYATEYRYVKEVKGKIQWDANPSKGRWWVDTGKGFGWETWSGGSEKWAETDTDVLETGAHSAVQSEWSEKKIDYRKLTTKYRYVATGETRQGRLVTEAWTEQVLVKEAWTETIEHPAVVCPDEPPVEEPEEPQEPVVPEQPAPDVFTYEEQNLTCELVLTTVTQTFTTPYVWDDSKWVLDDHPADVQMASSQRTVTVDEAREINPDFDAECTSDTPEPEPGTPEYEHKKEFEKNNPDAVYSPVENG